MFQSILLLLYILVNAVSIDACAATGRQRQIAVPAKRTTTTSKPTTTTLPPTTTTTTATTTTPIPTTTTPVPTTTSSSTTTTTSTSTTTTTCFTTTTPIPCTCPTGTLQIFVTSDVTAALVDPMCNEPVSQTCATGNGQYECYVPSTVLNPFFYCTPNQDYAFSVLNSACASFCACDRSGVCYTPFNPNTVVRYRFAPFCNAAGFCCINLYIENLVIQPNTGVISSTGTIYPYTNELIPPGDFTCTSAGVPFPFDIVYVSCGGCPTAPTNPCAATG